jgi:hypothetical protein
MPSDMTASDADDDDVVIPGGPATTALPKGGRPLGLRLIGQAASLLGGFGLGTAAALSGQPIAWVVVALLGGVILRGGLAAGWLGLVAAAVAFASFDSLQAGYPPSEYGSLQGTIAAYGVFFVALLTPIGLVAYQLVEVLRGEPWFAPPGPLGRVTAAIPAAYGAIAFGATTITLATLLSVPASHAFDLPMSAGWTALEEEPRARDPAYGEVFTAVFGSNQRPEAGGPADHPVVGVSVIRFTLGLLDCQPALRGWPGGKSVLFDAPILESGPIELPAGAAFRVVREPQPGATFRAYTFLRTRVIGLIREPLCYVVTIALPSGSPVTEADADAIIRSFRFR